MIYRVQNPMQLAVYHATVLRACQQLVDETHLEKTAVDVYAEILEHFAGPGRGMWCVLRDGDLVSFITAKIYHDENRRHCCITWAWSQSPTDSPLCHNAVMAWATDEGCTEVYCSRRTRIDAFFRILRPYGWEFEAVVFKKRLEVPDGEAVVTGEHAAVEYADPPPAVARLDADPRVGRADGAAAEHGDLDPTPAVDFQSASRLAPDAGQLRPRRRTRQSTDRTRRRRRVDAAVGAGGAGMGTADPGTTRSA